MDGFSPGFTPPAGQEAEHQRRLRAVVKIDDDADADSLNRLGGYHGSTHVTSAGADTAVYAVGVYSEGRRGSTATTNIRRDLILHSSQAN